MIINGGTSKSDKSPLKWDPPQLNNHGVNINPGSTLSKLITPPLSQPWWHCCVLGWCLQESASKISVGSVIGDCTVKSASTLRRTAQLPKKGYCTLTWAFINRIFEINNSLKQNPHLIWYMYMWKPDGKWYTSFSRHLLVDYPLSPTS